MLFAFVYKSHDHWSVHVPLILSYSSSSIQPNLHVYYCLSPWKPSFWGVVSQKGNGFQLLSLFVRVVSASAQNCKRNPWSNQNEARSRGLFLRGKRKTHQTGHTPCSYNQYLELHLESKAELVQVVESNGKTSFTHNWILSLPQVEGRKIYSLTQLKPEQSNTVRNLMVWVCLQTRKFWSVIICPCVFNTTLSRLCSTSVILDQKKDPPSPASWFRKWLDTGGKMWRPCTL